MSKREVKTNPRALQHIALAAVVIFGLVISYAIHMTNKTVAEVKSTHYNYTNQSLYQNMGVDGDAERGSN